MFVPIVSYRIVYSIITSLRQVDYKEIWAVRSAGPPAITYEDERMPSTGQVDAIILTTATK